MFGYQKAMYGYQKAMYDDDIPAKSDTSGGFGLYIVSSTFLSVFTYCFQLVEFALFETCALW